VGTASRSFRGRLGEATLPKTDLRPLRGGKLLSSLKILLA
jgi:hypothetical protein